MVKLVKMDRKAKTETTLEQQFADETAAQQFVDQETLALAKAHTPRPWPSYRIVPA